MAFASSLLNRFVDDDGLVVAADREQNVVDDPLGPQPLDVLAQHLVVGIVIRQYHRAVRPARQLRRHVMGEIRVAIDRDLVRVGHDVPPLSGGLEGSAGENPPRGRLTPVAAHAATLAAVQSARADDPRMVAPGRSFHQTPIRASRFAHRDPVESSA